VRTLVGSIGLVLAVPLTTFIGTMLAWATLHGSGGRGRGGTGPRRGIVDETAPMGPGGREAGSRCWAARAGRPPTPRTATGARIPAIHRSLWMTPSTVGPCERSVTMSDVAETLGAAESARRS
jgi:hypothetical protein